MDQAYVSHVAPQLLNTEGCIFLAPNQYVVITLTLF